MSVLRSMRDRLIVEWDVERLDFILAMPAIWRERRAFRLVGGPADGLTVEGWACPDAVFVDGEDGRYLPLFPDYAEMHWWRGPIDA